VVLVTLEDETGAMQVICWKRIRGRQREALLRSRLLAVHGRWQRESDVCALLVGFLQDFTHRRWGVFWSIAEISAEPAPGQARQSDMKLQRHTAWSLS
jgi:DNA polymerase III alpha subunit